MAGRHSYILQWEGHEAVVRLLLDTGGSRLMRGDHNGETPLAWAAEKGMKPSPGCCLIQTGLRSIRRTGWPDAALIFCNGRL